MIWFGVLVRKEQRPRGGCVQRGGPPPLPAGIAVCASRMASPTPWIHDAIALPETSTGSNVGPPSIPAACLNLIAAISRFQVRVNRGFE